MIFSTVPNSFIKYNTMTRKIFTAIVFLMYYSIADAQDWVLKIKSNVQLRSWNLTTVAVKDEVAKEGALISLYNGTVKIAETRTEENGDFLLFIPYYGEYTMEVSSPGCNTKKIEINTNGIPEKYRNQFFRPSISIDGFVMALPIPGVDYSGLKESLVKIEYDPSNTRFHADQASMNKGLERVGKINDAEDAITAEFCAINKMGDDALQAQDCELAKKHYEKAIAMIPGAQYPVDQMRKADRCIKAKEEEIAAKNRILQYQSAVAETDAKIKSGQEVAYASNSKTVELSMPVKNEEAVAVTGNNSNETSQVKMIDSTELKAAAAEQLLTESRNNYAATLKVADGLFAKKKWDEAEAAYYEALQFLPNETYAKTQIVAINKNLSRENPGINDRRFRESIVKAEKYLGEPYKNEIIKNYQDALAYVGDAEYEKNKNVDTEKWTNSDGSVKSPEFIAAMLAKYPTGLTEETITARDVVIIRRVLVKDGNVWVYQKKTFSWGGVAYFRDGLRTTATTFDYEAKL